MANDLTAKISNQLSTLDHEITRLANELQPGRDDQISARLMMLAKAGFAWPKNVDQSKALDVYGFALARVPFVGLKMATEKLVAGEYPEASKDFMPSPAALADLARREASVKVADRARLRERRETLASGLPDRNTPERQEAIARVREMVRGVRRDNEAFNAQRRGEVEEPMDPAREEYWRSILALPDRPDISRQQREEQSKIRAKFNEGEHNGE